MLAFLRLTLCFFVSFSYIIQRPAKNILRAFKTEHFFSLLIAKARLRFLIYRITQVTKVVADKIQKKIVNGKNGLSHNLVHNSIKRETIVFLIFTAFQQKFFFLLKIFYGYTKKQFYAYFEIFRIICI